MLGGLAGLLGLAAGDDGGLAGGAEALLELLEALEREVSSACMASIRCSALAHAGQLGAQRVEPAGGRLGDLADLAQLAAQRGGAVTELLDLGADGVHALAAGAELGAQRGQALVEALGRGARGGGVGASACWRPRGRR